MLTDFTEIPLKTRIKVLIEGHLLEKEGMSFFRSEDESDAEIAQRNRISRESITLSNDIINEINN